MDFPAPDFRVWACWFIIDELCLPNCGYGSLIWTGSQILIKLISIYWHEFVCLSLKRSWTRSKDVGSMALMSHQEAKLAVMVTGLFNVSSDEMTERCLHCPLINNAMNCLIESRQRQKHQHSATYQLRFESSVACHIFCPSELQKHPKINLLKWIWKTYIVIL